ncbi:uncharacterized protein LOC143368324 isoform X2 [Andrena cerasifolii]|uniref:uncharacterized protein LOC143368324 isoform X2 n=1 Tax=Andrena cerasifolii TaxID=2819439 RepID=UPI004037BB85
MDGKHFGWDEISDGLILGVSIPKAEDEPIKRHQRIHDTANGSDVYSPHAYLILNFRETLSQREQLRFRRFYLRQISPNEPNIIILQDIKDLVLFLLASPVSPQFINFFHLPIVDRFLRAVIIYFEYYMAIWEDLMAERAATMKKAPNPLARGYRSRYAKEMQNLRCILGREYADLIVGCQDTIQYHHMTSGNKGMTSLTQSQGEKDLRMFEVLICMSHRIAWIALERKYFGLIGKLGREVQEKRKLLRNSPIIEELIYSNTDYRLLSLGIGDDCNDERIVFLQNALLAREDELQRLGIKIGILGQNKADFDLLLMPQEEEQTDEIQISDRRKFDAKKSAKDTSSKHTVHKIIKTPRLPLFQTGTTLVQHFPITIKDIALKGYQTVREEARKKWLIREIKRRRNKGADTFSIGTLYE